MRKLSDQERRALMAYYGKAISERCGLITSRSILIDYAESLLELARGIPKKSDWFLP